MARISWHTHGGTKMEGTVRMRWLKAMYIANIIVSLPLGLAVLVAPEVMRGLLGIPAGDPIHYGLAAGAVPLAFGLAGVLGLRAPLRFCPVLALQVLYKSLFLIGVVLPRIMTGQLPDYAMPLIIIFILFIIGNLIAIPMRYLLSPALDRR